MAYHGFLKLRKYWNIVKTQSFAQINLVFIRFEADITEAGESKSE